MKNLLVIDGNSILNRQFYGVHPLTTKSGLFTNAVYGFLNVLLTQLDALSPDYAAVAFDVHAPTFRHKEYADYKAGRRSTPPELLQQFPYAKRVVEALGIHILEKEGWEADDILGTLARYASEDGDTHAWVLTGDRDSLQLISDRCTVLLATNTETVPYNREKFKEKYGVSPEQFVDMKALMGDSSDNIPGVSGIGEKTASKLIAEWGDLDTLYANLDKIKKSKMLDNLIADKDSAYLSRYLAKIVTDVPLEGGLAPLCREEIHRDELLALLTELEFAGFIKKLNLNAVKPVEIKKESLTLHELSEKDFGDHPAIDLTDGSIEICDGETVYTASFGDLAELRSFFMAESRAFRVYDSKNLFHMLAKAGIAPVECASDVLLAAYVLSPTDNSYEISRLSTAYLGTSSEGAQAIYALSDVLEKELADKEMLPLYRDLEIPLAKVLFLMEERGMLIDRQGLLDFSAMLEQSMEEDTQKIYALAGHEFNIGSPKQLGVVLFEELDLPVYKKTKSGYSTSAEILEKLRPYHPIIDLILDYRQVTKLKSTYADGLPAAADPDGRVRTSFNQTVTATGRLSSTEPNLQNIPIRTELGRELRKFFPAPDGYSLIDADYSQIELRLLAHISGDPIMIDAFNTGADIHTITASQVFGVEPEAVTSEMRKRAKAVNFGIVYGIGDYSLSQDLKITKAQAAEYIRTYKERYKGVEEYLSAAVEQAYRNGYVVTMLGRRRAIPELSAPQAMMRAFGERVAMNSPIQGSAADIIKLAMVGVERALSESGLDARLIMQVHDELIVEASDADAPAAAEILRREMESALKLSVPLTADVKIGKRWHDCH